MRREDHEEVMSQTDKCSSSTNERPLPRKDNTEETVMGLAYVSETFGTPTKDGRTLLTEDWNSLTSDARPGTRGNSMDSK